MDIVTSFPTYYMDFVHGLMVAPNYIYVGVIALFFGVVAVRLPGVLFLPVLAAIVYVAAQIVIPAVVHHTAIVTPVFDLALAKKLVALYIVFLIVDTVVFAIKKAVLAVIG
jgi:hypothetical protein